MHKIRYVLATDKAETIDGNKENLGEVWQIASKKIAEKMEKMKENYAEVR